MSKEDQRIHPYPVRLTKELREQLDIAAKASGRSLNAEMLLRLEASFQTETKLSPDSDNEEMMRQIAREVVWEELRKHKEKQKQ